MIEQVFAIYSPYKFGKVTKIEILTLLLFIISTAPCLIT